MKSIAIFSIVLSFLKYNVFAQWPMRGDCPNVPAITNFEPTKYAGQWFESEKIMFIPEITGSCISVNFSTFLNDGSFTSQIRFKESISNMQVVWPGEVSLLKPLTKLEPPLGTGELQLSLNIHNPMVPQVAVQNTYLYRIASIDYDKYAIHWACYSIGRIHFESAWVLTRDQIYHPEVKEKVRAEFVRLGMDPSLLTRTDQNCALEMTG